MQTSCSKSRLVWISYTHCTVYSKSFNNKLHKFKILIRVFFQIFRVQVAVIDRLTAAATTGVTSLHQNRIRHRRNRIHPHRNRTRRRRRNRIQNRSRQPHTLLLRHTRDTAAAEAAATGDS